MDDGPDGTPKRVEIEGSRDPVTLEIWADAYIGNRIADGVWFPTDDTRFRGTFTARRFLDLTLIEVDASLFGLRWTANSVAAPFVGVSINTRPFRQHTILSDHREFLSISAIDVWDAAALSEWQNLAAMSQLLVLVPKAALHMAARSTLALPSETTEQERAALRLLRRLTLNVSSEAPRLGPEASEAARRAIVDILQSIVAGWRRPTSVAVSVDMRLSVIRWIDENLQAGRLPAAAVAETHAISVRSLHRLFAQSGETFGSVVRRRRLERARRDLLCTDDMIQTIAARWGYADASQFIHEFKRAHGATPAAYRESVTRPPS